MKGCSERRQSVLLVALTLGVAGCGSDPGSDAETGGVTGTGLVPAAGATGGEGPGSGAVGGAIAGGAGGTLSGGAASGGFAAALPTGGTGAGGIGSGGLSSGGAPGSGGIGSGGLSSGGAPSTGGLGTGAAGSGGGLDTGGGSGTGGALGTGGSDSGGASATGGAVGSGGDSAGGVSGSGGGVATGGAAGTGGAATGCPYEGHVTYTFNRVNSPTAEQEAAITEAMDTALEYYNCYTNITKELSVSYNPDVQTADGNVNGSIRFGSQASMNFVTAAHEVAHTVGVGYYGFPDMNQGGIWTGAAATQALREITGDPSAELHSDAMHFWPYGLNFTSEYKSEADIIAHCTIVVAIRQDLGL